VPATLATPAVRAGAVAAAARGSGTAASQLPLRLPAAAGGLGDLVAPARRPDAEQGPVLLWAQQREVDDQQPDPDDHRLQGNYAESTIAHPDGPLDPYARICSTSFDDLNEMIMRAA
jgi:hypothetical protein